MTGLSLALTVLKIISTVVPLFALWFIYQKGRKSARREQEVVNAEAQKRYAEIAAEEDPSDDELGKILDSGRF